MFRLAYETSVDYSVYPCLVDFPLLECQDDRAGQRTTSPQPSTDSVSKALEPSVHPPL